MVSISLEFLNLRLSCVSLKVVYPNISREMSVIKWGKGDYLFSYAPINVNPVEGGAALGRGFDKNMRKLIKCPQGQIKIPVK
jgi:hypothetical protein